MVKHYSIYQHANFNIAPLPYRVRLHAIIFKQLEKYIFFCINMKELAIKGEQ